MDQKFYSKDWTEVQRVRCQVYTRVMGYLRPASHYNIGKKSEFYSRKYFDESKTTNSEFMRKFGQAEVKADYSLVGGYEKAVQFVWCGCMN